MSSTGNIILICKCFWNTQIREILDTCELWDIWSDWWENTTWPTKRQRQRQIQKTKTMRYTFRKQTLILSQPISPDVLSLQWVHTPPHPWCPLWSDCSVYLILLEHSVRCIEVQLCYCCTVGLLWWVKRYYTWIQQTQNVLCKSVSHGEPGKESFVVAQQISSSGFFYLANVHLENQSLRRIVTVV